MRLTLRNLLAYMHGMMSPEDTAAFDALVKSTPKVQALIDRCRELPQRADLAAPAPDSTGNHSADAVACYLDFSLADAQLPGFEKGVLAADEQLAEISACHRLVADVLAQKVPTELPSWRDRILAVATQPTSASSPTDDSAPATAPHDQRLGSMNQAAQIERIAMQDSGDLSELLDDDDDELSVAAVHDREREKEQQAVAAAASAFAAGRGGSASTAMADTAVATTKPRLTSYGTRDPYKQATAGPALLEEKSTLAELPVALLGAVAGGVLVLGLVGWLIVSSLSGPSRSGTQGEKVYGVSESAGDTCELSGTITFTTGGGAPLPDSGALVLAWPVGESHASKTVRSAVDVMQDADSGMQSAYNEQLVVAKTDDNGRYRMRMHKNTEFHVVILSQHVQTDKPVLWGDTINELKTHVEDPATLVGRRVYQYQRLTMPDSGQATLDYTFSSDG